MKNDYEKQTRQRHDKKKLLARLKAMSKDSVERAIKFLRSDIHNK